MRRRMTLGAAAAIALAAAVALQWLPATQADASHPVSTKTEITLALRASGPAIQVEHGGLTLMLQF